MTTPRDRKELLRTLVEDVTIKVDRDKAAAHLALRWKGGALNEIDLTLPRSRPATIRTDEDTIELLRRLAVRLPRMQCDRRHPQSAEAGRRHMVIASPPAASATCAATGVFPASSRRPVRRRANY